MKKKIITAAGILVLGVIIFLSCKKESNDQVSPTYKDQATSTGNNPNTGGGGTT